MTSTENRRVRHLFEELVATLGPADHEPTLDELRAACDRWFAVTVPVPPDLRTERVDAGGVACLWASMPGTSTDRVILYLHGGAFVLGSPTAYRGFAAALSRAADAQVLIVEHRLAPENPHPAAVHDAVTAYRWLVNGQGDPASTIVAGDSSGGGLTLALLTALRDAGDALPAGAVCVSPWVDMTLSGPSVDGRAELDPFLSRAGLENMVGAYLQGQDPATPSASPLFAELAGLPPVLVLAGTCEVLLDDATRMADRARQAGIDVTVRIGEGMFHMWPIMYAHLPEARTALDEIGRFVKSHTQLGSVRR